MSWIWQRHQIVSPPAAAFTVMLLCLNSPGLAAPSHITPTTQQSFTGHSPGASHVNRGFALAQQKKFQQAIDEFTAAISSGDKTKKVFYWRAWCYYLLDKNQEAIADFNKAINLGRTDGDTYVMRGLYYANLDQDDKAIEDYKKAIELGQKDANTYWDRGISFAKLDQDEKAIEDYTRAIELGAHYADVYKSRGQSYNGISRKELAIKDFNKAIELRPVDVEAHYERGNTYQSIAQYQKAIDDYDACIRLNSKFADAYASRSSASGHLKNLDQYHNDWKTAIKLNPKIAVGKLGSYIRDTADGVPSWQSHFEFVNPDDTFAKEVLSAEKTDRERDGMDSWSQADIQTISEVLEKIEKKAPELIANAFNGDKIKLILLRHPVWLGEEDSAPEAMGATSALRMSCAPQLLNIKPIELEWYLTHELCHVADTDACISEGSQWNKLIAPFISSYHRKNRASRTSTAVSTTAASFGLPTAYAAHDPTEALAECTAAMIIDGWTSSKEIDSFIRGQMLTSKGIFDKRRDLFKKGYIEMQKADRPKAIAAYDAAINLNPQDAEAYFKRGAAYAANLSDDEKKTQPGQNPEEAELSQQAADDFNQAIKLDPAHALAYYNLGLQYELQKKTKDAINMYTQTLRINPEYQSALYHRGLLYQADGDWRLAVADFDAVIALEPTSDLAHGYRGEANYDGRLYTEAIADYNQAIMLAPQRAYWYYVRAQSYQELKKFARPSLIATGQSTSTKKTKSLVSSKPR